MESPGEQSGIIAPEFGGQHCAEVVSGGVQLAELNSLRQSLTVLVDSCEGDDRPDCPIIDDLAGEVTSEGMEGHRERSCRRCYSRWRGLVLVRSVG